MLDQRGLTLQGQPPEQQPEWSANTELTQTLTLTQRLT